MPRKSVKKLRKNLHRDVSDSVLPAVANGMLWNSNWREKEDLLRGYREAFSTLFGRVDSALSGREINVVQSPEVRIAATDGETIFFNSSLVTDIFKEAIKNSSFSGNALASGLIELRGLNYHELSHVLWSPRRQQKLFKEIVDADKTHPQLAGYVFKAYNILEDQRIESMFTSRFPASIPYLQNVIAKFIINGESTESAWLLLYGRKFLPYMIRQQAEAEFQTSFTVSNKNMESLKKIIDSYRKLILPKNADDALALIIQFATLIKKLFPTSSDVPDGTEAGQVQGGFSKGTTESVTSQKEVQRALEKQDEQIEKQDEASENDHHEDSNDEDSEDEDSEDSDSDSSDSDSGSDSDSDSSDSDSGKNSTDDDSDEDDSDDDSDSEESGADNNSGVPTSSKGNPAPSKSALKKLGEKLLEDVNKSLSADMTRQIKQIRNDASEHRFKRFFKQTEEPLDQIPPPPAYRALSNALSTELAKLKADTDNQWEHGSNIGSLNHLKKIESRGLHYDIFDQYLDDGDDRPDAEVVILLDQSSSMHSAVYDWDAVKVRNDTGDRSTDIRKYGTSLMQEASCASWAIKLACQSQDIACTVIGYHDTASALQNKSDTAKRGMVPVFSCYGGTHPASALRIASSVLAKSDARYKLIVTVTDGDWFQAAMCAEVVKELNQKGFHTLLIGLANGANRDPKTQKLEPSYPSALTEETLDTVMVETTTPASGVTHENKTVRVPIGYGFKTVVRAQDCKVLTKTVGKLLIKGVLANR